MSRLFTRREKRLRPRKKSAGKSVLSALCPDPGGQIARINASRLSERVEVPVPNDEIHRLAQTLNSMLDKLQASDAEQRRFVSDASHELLTLTKANDGGA